MIKGINPSIAELVYLINCCGLIPFDSHASFYPGDPEEQEYWIQKRRVDRDYKKEFNGPLVMLGVYLDLPKVRFYDNFLDIYTLFENIPKYWELDIAERVKFRRDIGNPHIVFYDHPALNEFNFSFLKFLKNYREREEIPESADDLNFSEMNVEELNKEIISKLPLTFEEFNTIRNNGIAEMVYFLKDAISEFDSEMIKSVVDKMSIINNRLFEFSNSGYF